MIFTSSFIGYKKPQIEFFKNISDKLQLKKNNILFWDDSQANINSARIFEFNGELYTSYVNFEKVMS